MVVILPHMQRHRGSSTAAEHDPDPMAYYSPEPPEPEQEPQPDSEQSGFVGSDSYHPELSGTDNLPSFSGPEYAYDFELFGSYSPGPHP